MMKGLFTVMMLVVGVGACAVMAAPQGAAATTAPVLVRDVKPAYSAAAMAAREQGRVGLTLTVKPDGTVGRVRVTQGLSRELDAAAVKAAKQWLFKPGTKNGKPVAVETKAEMTFTLR